MGRKGTPGSGDSTHERGNGTVPVSTEAHSPARTPAPLPSPSQPLKHYLVTGLGGLGCWPYQAGCQSLREAAIQHK